MISLLKMHAYIRVNSRKHNTLLQMADTEEQWKSKCLFLVALNGGCLQKHLVFSDKAKGHS